MTVAPPVPRRGYRTAGAGSGSLVADALTVWVASRVAVAVLAVAGAWTVGNAQAGSVPSFTSLWDHWDVGLFVKIARWGYGGYPAHYPDRGVTAFFPGEPLLLRLVHYVVPNWIVAGLLISAVAGAFGMVALARLGQLEGGPALGGRAVRYLVLSPAAVFLFAGYSEALFLAFALPAWYAARTGRWRDAGLLAGFASAVRITGLFLGIAIVVEYLLTRRARRREPGRPGPVWLVTPFLVVGGYFGYLYAQTGDWLAWSHAQQIGWGRSFTSPWRALHTTWHAAWDPSQGAAYAWSFRAEIIAAAVGIVLSVVLLAMRRWGEFAYVGLQVLAFVTSSFYLSIARGSLVWWPLWLLLARASLQRRWVHVTYLALAPPVGAALVVAFTQGHWVG